MTPAQDFWERALKTFHTAQSAMNSDPDSAASCFYYAAFYAVSALFLMEGKTFKKHSAVQAAVHRDLINAKRWPEEHGDDYSLLLDARETGDYGGSLHVLAEETEELLQAATRILQAVHKEFPDIFILP